MKKIVKIFSMVLALGLVFFLVACNKDKGATNEEKQAAETALQELYADTLGDIAFEVESSEDFTLVDKIGEYAVTWESKTPTVISNAGVVNRPAYNTDGGVNVVLVATIDVKGSKVEVEFNVFVVCLELTVEEELEAAVNLQVAIPATVLTDGITANYKLPSVVKFREQDLVVTWASNNTTAMEIKVNDKGEATANVYPKKGEEQFADLTATITFEGVTITKVVKFKVNEIEPSQLVESIEKLYETAKKGEYVKLTGVTVLGKVRDGIFVNDATGILYLYDNGKVIYSDLEIGKVYDIEGEFDIYYSAPQLKNAPTRPFTATLSTAAATDAPVVESTLEGLIDELKVPVNASQIEIFYTTYRFTAKVIIDKKEGATSDYDTWLVPTSFEGDAVIDQLDGGKAVSYLTEDVLNVYYQSNKALFAELHGKEVTIDFLIYGFRTDRKVWYGNFLGTAADIEVTMTDSEALAAAEKAITVPTTITQNTTLSLPTTMFGVEIAWLSSNDKIINPTTGVVVAPTTGAEEVTLTATLNVGELTKELEFVVSVGELSVRDIKDIYGSEKGAEILVEGVITGASGNGQVTIQDATAAFAVYNFDLFEDLTNMLGKKVRVSGVVDIFNGLYQLKDIEYEVIGDGTLPAVVDIQTFESWGNDLIAVQSQLVTADHLRIKSISNPLAPGDNQVEFVFVDDVTGFEIKAFIHKNQAPLFANDPLAQAKVGDYVKVEAHLGWRNGPQLGIVKPGQITMSTAPELSDEQKANNALAALNLPKAGDVTADITLPLTGNHGAVITWKASENQTAIVIENGVAKVTRGTEDVAVTLTYVLVVGEFELTDDIVVLVKKEADVPVDATEQLLVTYDFAGVEKGNELDDASLLATLLASDGNATVTPTVTGTTKTYAGNATGGGAYENKGGLIKVGTSSAAGAFSLTFAGENVTKVVITFASWKGDTVSINNSATQKSATDLTPSELTFELEATDTVNFNFAKRGLIFKIEIYVTK